MHLFLQINTDSCSPKPWLSSIVFFVGIVIILKWVIFSECVNSPSGREKCNCACPAMAQLKTDDEERLIVHSQNVCDSYLLTTEVKGRTGNQMSEYMALYGHSKRLDVRITFVKGDIVIGTFSQIFKWPLEWSFLKYKKRIINLEQEVEVVVMVDNPNYIDSDHSSTARSNAMVEENISRNFNKNSKRIRM